MPKRVAKDKVYDENGIRRFHGAFTGGFSAGYYNTVGSEEGFTPTGFISSRKQRVEFKQYTKEDFMDEQDNRLVGTNLQTHNIFSESKPLTGERSSNAPSSTVKKVNPEEVPLWGELPPPTYNESESESDQEQEQEVHHDEEIQEDEEPEMASIIPGSNAPAVPWRKDFSTVSNNEPKSLYTHLEEVEVSGGSGFLPPTKRYVIPGKDE